MDSNGNEVLITQKNQNFEPLLLQPHRSYGPAMSPVRKQEPRFDRETKTGFEGEVFVPSIVALIGKTAPAGGTVETEEVMSPPLCIRSVEERELQDNRTGDGTQINMEAQSKILKLQNEDYDENYEQQKHRTNMTRFVIGNG